MPMPAQPVIVVYGHDQSLLDTRTWVLEGAGYQVSQASEFSELERAAGSQVVGLVVMCHTLTPEQCDETRASLQNYRPSIKRLLITANRPIAIQAVGEPTISAFDGPRALIDMVAKVLSAKD